MEQQEDQESIPHRRRTPSGRIFYLYILLPIVWSGLILVFGWWQVPLFAAWIVELLGWGGTILLLVHYYRFHRNARQQWELAQRVSKVPDNSSAPSVVPEVSRENGEDLFQVPYPE